MQSVDLLRRAQHQQQTAHALIEALGLMELLRAVGDPVLIGSVRTGLMIDADIDIVVHTPGRPDIAACFEALRVLALHEQIVNMIYFENKLALPFAGLYLDIGCMFQDASWQCNIAVFGADCPHRHIMEQTADALAAVLDDRMRQTILTIKAERHRRFGPFRSGDAGRIATSLDLYRAALDGGATTYDEAVGWIERNPSPASFQPYRPR